MDRVHESVDQRDWAGPQFMVDEGGGAMCWLTGVRPCWHDSSPDLAARASGGGGDGRELAQWLLLHEAHQRGGRDNCSKLGREAVDGSSLWRGRREEGELGCGESRGAEGAFYRGWGGLLLRGVMVSDGNDI
jgi:hypothetical protein